MQITIFEQSSVVDGVRMGPKMTNKFEIIKKDCGRKMEIDGNDECGKRRLLISGLDGCLCRKDNCYKVMETIEAANEQ